MNCDNPRPAPHGLLTAVALTLATTDDPVFVPIGIALVSGRISAPILAECQAAWHGMSAGKPMTRVADGVRLRSAALAVAAIAFALRLCRPAHAAPRTIATPRGTLACKHGPATRPATPQTTGTLAVEAASRRLA